MPTRQEQAAAYNAAIAQGLSPAAAEIAAGITDANFGDFQEGPNGQLEPLTVRAATNSASTPGWQPEIDEDDDEEVAAEQAAQRQGTTTSASSIQTSTTATSGGGSVTRVVQPE